MSFFTIHLGEFPRGKGEMASFWYTPFSGLFLPKGETALDKVPQS